MNRCEIIFVINKCLTGINLDKDRLNFKRVHVKVRIFLDWRKNIIVRSKRHHFLATFLYTDKCLSD